jgi:hypothetical protein
MKVADLQSFLNSLAGPLSASGAKAVATDLEKMRVGLDPFKDLAVADFADFLVRAHQYSVNGTVPLKGGRGAKAAVVDQAKIDTAFQTVTSLYEKARDAAFQYAALDQEVKKLDKALSKEEALALAQKFELGKGMKSKKDALTEIRRKIAERREILDRVEM